MKKAVTIGMLANELGLSVSAVSKALNDYPDIGPETKALVLQKASELGYSPNLMARGLARQTSRFVGVVIRDVSSVYGEMFKSLSHIARRYDLQLILYDTDNDPAIEKRCVQNLIDSMALGIIIAPVREDAEELLEMTRGRVAVVFLGGRVRDEQASSVCTDSAVGTELALRQLMGLGHERIALLFDHRQSASRSTRLETYRRVMRSAGLEELVFCADEADLLAAGRTLGRRLLDSGEGVTAVFAVKDLMAIGVIQAVREAGKRVPEDLSVIGYDGINASALPMIRLSTIMQPRQEIAELVIEILLRHAADPEAAPEHCLVRPQLILRGTVDTPQRDSAIRI